MKKRFEGFKGGFVPALTRVVTSTKFIITVAVLVVIGTFGAWQYHNMTNQDRVFWGMVNNNLQTTAYTRHTQQKNGAQGVDQIFATATSPQNRLFTSAVFTQTGVDSARAVTENIGTPTKDYVRYTEIQTAQNLNFSSVLNVWGVSESQVEGQTTAQLYNQSVLGVIPVGNLTAAQRRQIVKTMHDKHAYDYQIVQTKRSAPFGRPTYTLQVTVNPVGYISALKEFAGFVGLNHLEGVNPEDYAKAQKLSFVVQVDGWTHQIVATSEGTDAKTEDVSGRNSKQQLPEEPKNAIPVDELQLKLQSIQ